MKSHSNLIFRPAVWDDALCLSVLAMQVFLDTYATDGIRPALASEVLSTYSTAAFQAALADSATRIVVAEQQTHLVGFVQIALGRAAPLAAGPAQAELVRLYVQEPFTSSGIGTSLLEQAGMVAASEGVAEWWLTVWIHNHRARDFYARRGFRDLGPVAFNLEGESHENRVLIRRLDLREVQDEALRIPKHRS